MEIAAYPVPYYYPPTFPQTGSVRPVAGNKTGLSSRDSGTQNPDERILQGEVLNAGKRKPNSENASTRYTFEQQARSARPDLSGLDASSRQAIQSYLDNEDLNNSLLNTRPLIDEYV